MIGVTVLAVSLISVWPGCKSGPSTGAVGAANSTRPRVVVATSVESERSGRHQTLDPFAPNFWQTAKWYSLINPATYPAVKAVTWGALAYGRSSLYVAFVGLGNRWHVAAASPDNLWRHNCVEIWLDTARRQNGANFYEIVISPTGRVAQVWHNTAQPPHPTADGGINFAQPFSLIPWRAPGLRVKVTQGWRRGQRAWAVVARVPLAGLPPPLRTTPRRGSHFRVNLIRYAWKKRADKKRHLVQYSLFAVAPAAQAFAPYRMGQLVLHPAPVADHIVLADPLFSLSPSGR